ncbi:hypothetical protein GEV33_007383 [Tenebrio molitor]|jgi:hypothetical protein|uniref:Uncharacterized protein n=1 Tax=Tenebrio molitor TaxID=7067 RepID=A0A8J6LD29_TENMO|nr:hypothetical protein GEV33_007383 [Tenebrio molitor]
MITRFRSRQLVGVVEEPAMDDAQPTQTNTEGESSQNSQVTPQPVVVMSHDETLRPVLPTGGSATPASSITAPTAVLRSEEYLPTFSGDPDDDPEDFISEVQEFFTAPANAILPERVKAKIAHRQLRGQAARVNKFFATRDRCLSDLETRLREEFGVEANFTSLYQQFQRGNLGWENLSNTGNVLTIEKTGAFDDLQVTRVAERDLVRLKQLLIKTQKATPDHITTRKLTITLKDDIPVAYRPRRLAHAERTQVKKTVAHPQGGRTATQRLWHIRRAGEPQHKDCGTFAWRENRNIKTVAHPQGGRTAT